MPEKNSDEIVDITPAELTEVDDVWIVKGGLWAIKGGEIFSIDLRTKKGFRKIQMPNERALVIRECARGLSYDERKACFGKAERLMKSGKSDFNFDSMRKDYINELVDNHSDKSREEKEKMKAELLESYYDIEFERR